MNFPRMMRVRQSFPSPRVPNIPFAVREELMKLDLSRVILPGQTVAVTAGSRGIANIAVITREVVHHLQSLQAIPFIVPAMGSHGGGTVEGQLGILAGYGITSESMGCEIRATMETIVVDRTSQGIPVHFDAHAAAADHVFVVNRVKPHTGFVGEIESGLHKMMLIGLGKHAGATVYHRAIVNHSFPEIIRAVADSVLRKCRILAGLAIVENARDETALIEAVAPLDFATREPELLKLANEWLPKLPFPSADLLIVDRIGKNISGTGMDTNVVGRKYNDHVATKHDRVNCKRIFVRGLTEETHGNACGIGIAEFSNQRTIAAIDWHITRVNCLTSCHPTAAMIPVSYETDAEAISEALGTIGLTPPEQSRVIQISDTLHLEELLVSEAYLPEFADRDDLELLTEPTAMHFDTNGNLTAVF